MALTDYGSGLSAADVAAVTGGNNGNGFGFNGDGAWWLLVLFLFMMNGNTFGRGGYGDSGMQKGFDQQAVMSGINGLTSAVSTGFANAEVSRCNGNMNTLQALNGITSNLADIKYTVATENCADRNALTDALRDVIASNTANTQAILDKMCQQEIEAKNETIAQLRTQLNMQALAASQNAQTAQILANNAAQTQALEQYLNPTPIPAYTVPNPNCCNSGWGNCGCN